MPFALHPQLATDTVPVGDLTLCRVLLMNNYYFPWLILVPMHDNLRELFDLSGDDYTQTMAEVRDVSQQFATLTGAHKTNIAALGNIVPQLHIHIIARFKHDAAWPQPVWNRPAEAKPYSQMQLTEILEKIRGTLPLRNITKM